MKNNFITAGFIIIGNEILSGRTVDQNLNFLAKRLSEIGILLKEVRIIGDYEDEIISTVNELRKKYNYIFTSGGIGPTHDDITSMSIAKAFNQDLILNDIAKKILIHHYGQDNLNDAKLKMAYLPRNASLLNNPISSAPGFKVENVFVMAGVPKIFQAMFNSCLSLLKTGDKIISRELKISLTESLIAYDLSEVQSKIPNISIGSYPFEGGTSLVFRGTNSEELSQAVDLMILNIHKINKSEKIDII